jgi:hypothetical protein
MNFNDMSAFDVAEQSRLVGLKTLTLQLRISVQDNQVLLNGFWLSFQSGRRSGTDGDRSGRDGGT